MAAEAVKKFQEIRREFYGQVLLSTLLSCSEDLGADHVGFGDGFVAACMMRVLSIIRGQNAECEDLHKNYADVGLLGLLVAVLPTRRRRVSAVRAWSRGAGCRRILLSSTSRMTVLSKQQPSGPDCRSMPTACRTACPRCGALRHWSRTRAE